MTATHTNHDCCDFPDLKRPNYFFGQMLGVREFRGEQSYFREKIKLLNRTLHGWGVVCGLTVGTPPPADDCGPEESTAQRQGLLDTLAQLINEHEEATKSGDAVKASAIQARMEEVRRQLDDLPPEPCDPPPSPTIRVDCGLALDCEGNELLLHRPVELDPMRYITQEQRDAMEPLTLWVSICYCAKPIEPSRPLQTQDCGITSDCEYGWTLDTVRFTITTTPPRGEEQCNPCCKACDEPSEPCGDQGDQRACCCVLLAVIDDFVPGQPIDPATIRNGVRRMLTVYDFTRVAGVNWVHGGVYTPDEAYDLLGAGDGADPNGGALEIHLTRDIRTSTLQPGVMDVWVIEGGSGRSGNIYHLAGDFLLPPDPYTNVIRYQQFSDETLQDEDCVLIMLRSEFILDRCCRAIDGAHIGGKVPQLPDTVQPSSEQVRASEDCSEPSWYPQPWRSGNHTEGSNFISWFFITTEGTQTARRKSSKKEARNA